MTQTLCSLFNNKRKIKIITKVSMTIITPVNTHTYIIQPRSFYLETVSASTSLAQHLWLLAPYIIRSVI